jgi:hypothetical protein
MSNNQYHSRELVNKTATHRKLWVAVFGSFANDYLQFNIDLCLETAEVEGLNPITSVTGVFHTVDLEDMCTLDTKASEHNECNIHQTPYLTKLIQIKEALRHEGIELSNLFNSPCIDLSNQIIKPLLEKAI